jgi:hypothetical protein
MNLKNILFPTRRRSLSPVPNNVTRNSRNSSKSEGSDAKDANHCDKESCLKSEELRSGKRGCCDRREKGEKGEEKKRERDCSYNDEGIQQDWIGAMHFRNGNCQATSIIFPRLDRSTTTLISPPMSSAGRWLAIPQR